MTTLHPDVQSASGTHVPPGIPCTLTCAHDTAISPIASAPAGHGPVAPDDVVVVLIEPPAPPPLPADVVVEVVVCWVEPSPVDELVCVDDCELVVVGPPAPPLPPESTVSVPTFTVKDC